ncbi:MAG: hypothetical protein LC791_06695 [Acidobacteria bacterium]|nr:hypothetical protein [Acidobacteriota bacterium]
MFTLQTMQRFDAKDDVLELLRPTIREMAPSGIKVFDVGRAGADPTPQQYRVW